eukprot:TRINITY_DN30796_c0_g1_i1.p2 TRINITY_DN30796_c0_g1~~TRINITY_DN30796_c0_g1_i1.p2  ORF type:complete len:125 (+),score=26.39 TRINITY_DN30796_c0_g1_i1:424-798(+)
MGKQVGATATMDLMENFVAAYDGTHCMLHASTVCCNHFPHGGEKNIEVRLEEGSCIIGDKHQIVATRDIAANEELFLDYAQMHYPEFYQEFCQRHNIRDVRTNVFAAISGVDDVVETQYGRKKA